MNNSFPGPRSGSDSRSAEPVVSSLPTEDPEIRQIVSDFLVRLREKVRAMSQAYSVQDFSTLRELAHWLKGSGGTVGFGCLTEAARGLESASKSEQLADAKQSLEEIEDLVRRIEL